MAYQMNNISSPFAATTASSSKTPSGQASAPSGNTPTTPSASATSDKPAAQHVVALIEENKEYYDQNISTFSRMRVTIHTTGAWPNSAHSDNHVTILLLLDNKHDEAVQVNMRTDTGDIGGQLQWKLVYFEHSITEIKLIDYDLGTPVQVKTLYNVIRNDWKLHQYRFSPGGSGCHYWKNILIPIALRFAACY